MLNASSAAAAAAGSLYSCPGSRACVAACRSYTVQCPERKWLLLQRMDRGGWGGRTLPVPARGRSGPSERARCVCERGLDLHPAGGAPFPLPAAAAVEAYKGDLLNKSYYPTGADASNVNKRWYVIDAKGQTLGRLATLAAMYIRCACMLA